MHKEKKGEGKGVIRRDNTDSRVVHTTQRHRIHYRGAPLKKQVIALLLVR